MNRLKISLFALLASTAVSFGASFTWNGGSGDWSVAGNWAPNGVPGASDTATVNSGTVTVSADTTAGTLNLGGGALNGSGTLTVSNVMAWTGGVMSGAGRTVIGEGATLNVSNPGTIILSVRALENAGTVNWNGSGLFSADTSAVITNRVGALFVAQSDTVLLNGGGAVPRFDNAGVFRKSAGTGTNTLSLPFNNYGTNEVQTGTLLCNSPFNNDGRVDVAAGAINRLAGGGAASGTFAVASGGLVDFSASAYSLNAGVQLTGTGFHRISGGILSVNGGVVAQNLELSGSGALNGSGTLTISNVMTWTAGVMAGAGRTVIVAGATLNVSNPGTIILSERTLENAGTVNWNGSGLFNTETSAVITNRAGALFVAQSDAVLQNNGGTPPRFDNAGIFRKSAGTGTTSLSLTFNNYGTVDVQSGVLLPLAAFNVFGTVTVAALARVDFTTGTYNLAAGAQLLGAGLHRLSSGTWSVNGSVDVQNLELSGGGVTGSGTLTVNGTMTWTAGNMGGAGRTVIAAGGMLNVSNPGTIILSGWALENAGTVNWNGSGLFSADTSAVITNRVGALFVAQSDTVLQNGGGAAPRFDNAGIFRKTSGTATTLALPFNNYGTNEVQTGTLLCNTTFNNYNWVDVAAGATNRLAGGGVASGTFAVASGGLVDLSAANYNLESGAQLLGAGLHRISGGILSVNGDVVAQSLELSGTGALNGSGMLTISNVMTWTAGNMAGGGRTVIAAGATLNINNPGTITLSVRTLENAGTVNWTGSGAFNTDNSAVVTNRAGALFVAQSDAVLQFAGGTATRFDNAGTFRKAVSTGTNTLILPFNNYGTVELQTGFLACNSGFFPASNSVLSVPISGTTPGTGYGRLQVGGAVTLNGALSVDLVNGYYPTPSVTYTVVTATARSGVFSSFYYPSNDVGMAVSNTASSVYVKVINVRPNVPVIANQTIDEVALFSLAVNATDDDLPAQTLTYTLTNSPDGASANASGQINWMPSEAQGPMTTNITVRVTDNGTPNLTVSRTFQVVVHEINIAPSLTLLDTNVNEMTAFAATAIATDPDIPTNAPLIFELVSGPPGLTVSTNGAMEWSPTEVHGSNAYTVTIRVTDTNEFAVNEKQLSTTNSFTLTVNEVNLPPVLTVPGAQTLDELTTLTLTNTASDPDLPLNGLMFTLVSPPAGMTIDPASGVISWTPAEDQGSNTFGITVVITDDSPWAVNAQHLSITNTFMVTVNESNRPPVLTVPGPQILNELTTLTVTNSAADPDLPANALTFALISPPTGMTIDSASGVINWTPTEAQGSNVYTITVSVTDTNSTAINTRSLSVTDTFVVTVNESNSAPALTLPADATINELTPYSVNASATDADEPANSLTFALVSGPAGLTVSSSGAIAWTPDETQGPTTNTVTISVTDTNLLAVNATSLSVTGSYQLIVAEVNVAPVLGAMSDHTLSSGQTISFTVTATDADRPTNTLSFSLLNPPGGATIHPGSGLFQWRVEAALAATTNVVQVRVTDDGIPNLNDTKFFTVIVNPAVPVVLTPVRYTNGTFTMNITGPIAPDYVLLASTNLAQWTALATNVSPVTPFQFIDSAAGSFNNRAYRVQLSP